MAPVLEGSGAAARWLIVALLALFGSRAGALQWETTTIATEASPLQAEVRVAFAFTNAGSDPVTIEEIKSGCDCLDATTGKKTYRPGQRGRVVARFVVGDRIGMHERSVLVRTDEPGEPTTLTVRVRVPAPARIDPRDLEWDIGGSAIPKTADVVVDDSLTIDFAEVFSTCDVFQARLETIQPGRKYRLIVTPLRTREPASGAIRIAGREKSGQDILISAYPSIK